MPGVKSPSLRRLTRAEIDHSIDDFLGFDTEVVLQTLPPDGAGGAGFDTCADTLFLSPLFLDGWLLAAREIAELAVPNAGKGEKGYSANQEQAHQRWFGTPPKGSDAEISVEEHSQRIAADLARTLWRRPPTEEGVDRLLQRFRRSMDQDPDFRRASREMVVQALVSPRFLFRTDDPPIQRLASDHTLAERLSFFLTAGPPDEVLLSVADAGILAIPEVLHDQADRLIDAKGARRFAERFVVQWLEIEAIGHSPAVGAVANASEALRRSMIAEPVKAFLTALREDRPVFDLIGGDTVFLDERLARHYGMTLPKVEDREEPPADDPNGASGPAPVGPPPFREVSGNGYRGGVLSSAAMLSATSLATRTSPVVRGRFILDRILGTPPPPPPPDAGSLLPSPPGSPAQSVRERLEEHRRAPACASCHATMDPLGFALEAYGPLGRWRDDADGLPVDASFELSDGTQGAGLPDLKEALSQRRDPIERHLTRLLVSYAAGADPGSGYGVDVESTLANAKASGTKSPGLRRLIHAILDGSTFRETQPRTTKTNEER